MKESNPANLPWDRLQRLEDRLAGATYNLDHRRGKRENTSRRTQCAEIVMRNSTMRIILKGAADTIEVDYAPASLVLAYTADDHAGVLDIMTRIFTMIHMTQIQILMHGCGVAVGEMRKAQLVVYHVTLSRL